MLQAEVVQAAEDLKHFAAVGEVVKLHGLLQDGEPFLEDTDGALHVDPHADEVFVKLLPPLLKLCLGSGNGWKRGDEPTQAGGIP